MVTLTDKQDAVAQGVDAWLADPAGEQFKYLAGYAGTGKTTIAKKLAEGRSTAFAAFTGKAAQVLREKGCDGATTVHKLIYRPDEKVVRTDTGEQLYQTEFVARDDDPLTGIDLLVLDECSMISAAMAQDLLSYGKRILVLGDPFQLPPVQGDGYFTARQPDWLLTEVHRQAAESGILRLATDVREGRGVLAPDSYGPDCAVISIEEATANEAALLKWADMVLVGTHRLRGHFNRQYREAQGSRGPYPERDDRLVCLQNDHRRGLLNGEVWRAIADARESGHMKLDVPIRSMDGENRQLIAECWSHDFLGLEQEFASWPWKRRVERARFTYGYALTVHKSQGSEFEKVLLIDESSAFREHSAQWMYTAVTRASKQLVVVRR